MWASDRAAFAPTLVATVVKVAVAVSGAAAVTAAVVTVAVTVAIALAGAWPSSAFAQRPLVTDADIARAASSPPVLTDRDLERAARQHHMPGEAERGLIPAPAAPRLDALPRPLSNHPLDLDAIARGHEAMGAAAPQASAPRSGPTLLVFVSFSMPEPTLTRLVDQAARAGATLVLRGFVEGSLRQTVLRVQGLIGQRQVGFQIDPQAFDRFSVSVTPSFVLIRDGVAPAPCAAGTCWPASAFALAAGDVSIDYALEHIRRVAPGFERAAGIFLSRLEGR